MAYFAITYDLIKRKDYSTLWEEMESLNAHKAMNSFYLLEVNNTATQIKDHLKNFTDADDKLMVVEFSKKPTFTKANAGTNDWLNERFS